MKLSISVIGGASRAFLAALLPAAVLAAVLVSSRPEAGSAGPLLARPGLLPLSFVAGAGPEAGFVARAPGFSAAVGPGGGLVLIALGRGRLPRTAGRLTFAGGSSAARPAGEELLPGQTHSFLGADPRGWRTHLATWARVRCRDVYPGIDAVYYGRDGRLEYDLVVEPGADPGRIGLRWAGAGPARVDAAGDLLLPLGNGTLRQHRPVAYQLTSTGLREPVAASYRMAGPRPGLVRLALGRHDRHRPLVIDPVIAYSTYLGGRGFDQIHHAAVDRSGSLYVVGTTQSTNFPTRSPFQRAFAGGESFGDVFVTKLSSRGVLVYSTYLGGTGDDRDGGVAVDASGSAFVVGSTNSDDFPVTPGAFDRTRENDSGEGFVAKLDPSGSRLVYATYLGGPDHDALNAVALAADGSACVAGSSQGPDFPLVRPTQAAFGGGLDAIVARLDPTGSMLTFSTYLGGERADGADALGLDAAGHLYVAGFTISEQFPATPGAFDTTYGGHDAEDGFAARLDPETPRVVYCTYVGGANTDSLEGLAVGADGGVLLTGSTISSDFPITKFGLFTSPSGGYDFFLTGLAPDGGSLRYSTFFGGSESEDGGRAALDAAGNLYITGTTLSRNYPVTRDAVQKKRAGRAFDAVVSKLSPNGGQLFYSTYLGGTDDENADDIVVDATGAIYVVGVTQSRNFPGRKTAQKKKSGSDDGFVAKITGLRL